MATLTALRPKLSAVTSISAVRSIVLMWFAWVLILSGFQSLVAARLQPDRPDYAVSWTSDETMRKIPLGKPYLAEPFLNRHVAWDSEYYLSIATAGYNDPTVNSVQVTSEIDISPTISARITQYVGDAIPLNYAFLPFYPTMMRVVAWPLSLLGMNPIATATLAGVIVSALGTLAAMIALYDISKDELGESGGIRTAFYLIAFPTGFFLLQVYTEGLFVGLAFTSLALMRREKWVAAAIVAVFATWTRAVGVVLIIPLVLPWLQTGEWTDLDLEWRELYFKGIPWRALGRALIHLAPLGAFLLWKTSYIGWGFSTVEELFFGRGFFQLGTSFFLWSEALGEIGGDIPNRSAYYLIELGGIVLGILACIKTWRRYPAISAYGLIAILLALTSGPAQGMHRYILAAPSVFLFLGSLGRHPAFDRAWTIASVLLMGMMATLFTYDFWVG